MSNFTQIRRDAPRDNFDKLVIEFVDTMHEATQAFFNMNKKSYSNDDLINAVSMGCIAFSSDCIKLLSEDVKDKKLLVKYSIELFMKYMDEIK